MKISRQFSGFLFLCLAISMAGCAKKSFKSWNYIKSPDISVQLKSFVAEKAAQADSATNEPAPEFAVFFAAAQKGDWETVSNAFADFQKHAPQFRHSGTNDVRLTGTPWAAVLETWGAFAALHDTGEKYFKIYADEVIQSITPGGIYFGGTDAGRFVITAMQKSQVTGDPFFTLTQNALADSSYLDYLRAMYGGQISIPTSEDLQQSFQDYSEDALKRKQEHQLKWGETVKIGPDGKPQISGIAAVMAINGLLAKIIFDKNPNLDFYLQQSFPLDWMYPYLEPHGLIFKIDREPQDELPEETLQDNDDYWAKAIAPMIGNWLARDTAIADVITFDRKVFYAHHFSGFTGDRDFIRNRYAAGIFAWDRSNIANLYVWRLNHATNPDEKERMAREADFAFRQALALDPRNSQTVNDYRSFLRSQNRDADAALLNTLTTPYSI